MARYGVVTLRGYCDSNNRSVRGVRLDGAELAIEFSDGSTLHVSGEPDDVTTGDVWWFSPWRV